jgi:predicted translin family RNA/ssDNA-binding protein
VRRFGLLSPLLVLAACGGSPSEQARKLHETQQSWEETTRLTTELWRSGAVTDVYARQTLEAASQELEKVRRKAEQLSQ